MKKYILTLFFITLLSAKLEAFFGFNTNGYVNADQPTDSNFYHDVTIDSNGKIIVVGTTDSANGLIARYNTDGTIDTTFNTTGYINTDNPANSKFYFGVATDSNGKIVVVGTTDAIGIDNEGIIIRYENDGTIDTTFNTTGYVNAEVLTKSQIYYSVALDSSDRIVTVGATDDSDGLIARYTSAGALDITFNTTGSVSTDLPADSFIYYDVAIDSNNKIVVVGGTDSLEGLIARYNTDGTIDTTFNVTGYVKTEGGTDSKFYYDVAIDGNGKIIVVGTTNADNGVIARYNSDGTIDTTFNTTGYVNTDAPADSKIYYGVTIDSSGKIIVVGSTDADDGIIARYNSDGTIDTTFNTTGYINTDAPADSKIYYSVILDESEHIIAVGTTDATDGLIIRYLADGVLDTSTAETIAHFVSHYQTLGKPLGLLG